MPSKHLPVPAPPKKVIKVQCSHVSMCDEDYRKDCPHAVPHEPKIITHGYCHTTSTACNAGSDGDVLCVKEGYQYRGGDKPERILNSYIIDENQLKVFKDLIDWTEENAVNDESADDGGKYPEEWRSPGFQLRIKDAKNLIRYFESEISNPPVEVDPGNLSCTGCKARGACKFVDDPYNTDGDCLAMK